MTQVVSPKRSKVKKKEVMEAVTVVLLEESATAVLVPQELVLVQEEDSTRFCTSHSQKQI